MDVVKKFWGGWRKPRVVGDVQVRDGRDSQKSGRWEMPAYLGR